MTAPLPWQEGPIVVAARALRERRSLLDASDCGVGKTFTALFAAKEAGLRLGVIVPKVGIPGWKRAAELVGAELAFATNIESLKTERDGWLRRGPYESWKWHLPPNTAIVFDEAHLFSGYDSQNGMILASAPRPALMLSATIGDSPLKLRAVGKQLGLFRSWDDWTPWIGQRGCKYNKYFGGYQWVGHNEDEDSKAVAKTIMDDIHRTVFHTGRGVRVKIADLGTLFPAEVLDCVSVPVADPESIDDAYSEELVALRENAPNALAFMTRARQLAEWQKTRAMVEMARCLIEEGRSVVLFVNYRKSLEWIANELECPFIVGDQPDREDHRLRFQNDEARAIAVMTDAGGMSCDLHDVRGQYPRTSLISLGFRADYVIQNRGRIRRATGKSPVHQRFIFADGTIETESIRPRVEAKLACLETLNDGDLTLR